MERTGFKTTYKPTSLASDKHYDVDKILDYGKYDDGSSGFLVKWVGHHPKEATWVLEEDLATCYQLVKDFRRENNLCPTELKPVAGCSLSQDTEVSYNVNNRNTREQVKAALDHFTRHEKHQTDLPMAAILFEEARPGPPLDDTIVQPLLSDPLVTGCPTCHIIGWKKPLPNGTNKAEVQIFRDRNLMSWNCLDSFKVDHCGSAAVLGCMELALLYKHEQLVPQDITFQPFLKTRIIAYLHPEESNPYPGRIGIQDRKLVWTCDYCQQFSTKKRKKSLLLHQRNRPFQTIKA